MIRLSKPSDYDSILAINLDWEHFLAPMDLPRLLELARLSDKLWVAEEDGEVVAFLLVFREGSEYDSANYIWFSEHLDKFYYIDRIAIREENQGKGLGRQLYEHLFAHAHGLEVERICCEYNYKPLNEGSRHFHATMGFEEMGRQELEDGKVVSMQAMRILNN